MLSLLEAFGEGAGGGSGAEGGGAQGGGEVNAGGELRAEGGEGGRQAAWLEGGRRLLA